MYAGENTSKAVYKRRAYILHDVYNCNDTSLDCTINIGELFTKLMIGNTSSTKKEYCVKGCFDKIEPVTVLEIAIANVFSEGFVHLQSSINKNLNTIEKLCCCCNNYSTNVDIEIGTYICLDISNYFIQFRDEDYFCTLQDIPIKLTLQNNNFQLSGVAVYEPGHYIAYCRSVSGEWDKRNDMTQFNKKIHLTDSEVRKKKIKLSLLFYVQL